MNYQETLNYLYNQLPVYQNIGGKAYKEGLDNSLLLDDYLGHPHKKYKTIHIAGTNGKGSTSHILAAILQKAGYKTGLYTSPHLVDFRERIRVNGEKISRDYIVEFVEKHRSYFEPISPSFFELTMMMAFQYFADEKVDIGIIEVGLGGRLDSTNIITPDLSVITNISFDHTRFLGNTLAQIAGEKAGIIKKDIPVIIGEAEGIVRTVFEEKAALVGAPIFFAEDDNAILSCTRQGGNWLLETLEYPALCCELGGNYQLKNAATVLKAVETLTKLHYAIPARAVYDGFAQVIELTGLSGRWQRLQDVPKVICDTGHNAGGIEYVVKQLEEESYSQLHIVIGMVNDKDISQILPLLPQKATYYFSRAAIERALDENELKKQAGTCLLKGKAFSSVKEAVDAALKNAGKDDLIFIGGSNFIVAEALPMF
ncbi:bifunctional folylpolyglutamate synthase/dihydrofolate synthase [Viscerimonas tarda]